MTVKIHIYSQEVAGDTWYTSDLGAGHGLSHWHSRAEQSAVEVEERAREVAAENGLEVEQVVFN
jgi:hypothetical protein